MNHFEIENNLKNLVSSISEESFIYDFLMTYGIPKATIKLLKDGKHNLSKKESQILLKKKVLFEEVKDNQDLHSLIYSLNKDETNHRHGPRFIIVTDYKTLLAIDTKTKESLDIPINELDKQCDFFLPWAGMEKAKYQAENPADIKAAYTLAKLYDAIREDNNISTAEDTHALNVFLSRILFCFFAEDTEIFPKDIFTYSIESHTQLDGSDLNTYLERLFRILNQPEGKRGQIPDYLDKFPYVNGGLFEKEFSIPVFKRKSRSILVECGKNLNWSQINPDIFGSMVQAVVHPDQRSGLGMHYTSVPNIMKVIKPLFLNELREEYEKNIDNPKKLQALLLRMEKIRIFDPACGSGNFLIISYKELRKLEMEILSSLHHWNVLTLFSGISISQFYGIEIDDFAHEIAGLALYIANHQMNTAFKNQFGQGTPFLPLKSSGNIVCANATRIDWEEVCPKEEGYEIYVLGNPPYEGARKQNKLQKEDMKHVFPKMKGANNLDYISIWFHKGAEYIRQSHSKCAFVSTNSICQGSQVSLLWKPILDEQIEIDFAYTSFKWSNNAKKNAGVTVVIIGLRNISKKENYIFEEDKRIIANHINAYLGNANDIYMQERRTPISKIPPINYGSFALDDGQFTLNESDRNSIISSHKGAEKFIKPFIGAQELIKGYKRYCIWIETQYLEEAMGIEVLKNRVKKVQSWREKSDRIGTKKLANTPWIFAENRQPNIDYWAFPTVSSERREYVPIANLNRNTIASNQIYVIPTDNNWIFGVITSRMHMTWIRAVCGSLETRIRYSSSLGYNTFPFPAISEKQKEAITNNVYNILTEREKHPEKTMAELYDPDKMPAGLREAHKMMDELIEQCYRATPFKSDEERLSYLFNLYEKMVENEKINK